MTDEQKVEFKKLSKKYGLGPDDYVELAFLILAIEYGLPEKSFAPLVDRDNGSSIKHLYLMANIIGADAEKIKINEKWKPKDELLNLIKSNMGNQNSLLGEYSRVSQIINDDTTLSAAQIFQLRKAVEVKLPEEEIIRMYYSGKDPIQMERTIEYNLIVRDINARANPKPGKWARFVKKIKGVFKHG